MTPIFKSRTVTWSSRVVLTIAGILFVGSAIELLRPLSAGGGPPVKVYVRPSMLELPVRQGETFLMGSPEDEDGHVNNENQHVVRLAGPFALSETEVTRGQFRRVMDNKNPAGWDDCTREDDTEGDDSELPVVCVTFQEAAEYCNRLTKLEFPEGVDSDSRPVTPCYDTSGPDVIWLAGFECRGYRLPTEAEWEYGARARRWKLYAGTDKPADVCTYGNVADLDARAVHSEWSTFDCSDGFAGPAPVGRKDDNGWGLKDMTGNVWEWVWDPIGAYPPGDSDDVGGPDIAGSGRVSRGGSWSYDPLYARVSIRYWRSPNIRVDYLGFRLSRSSSLP